MKTQVTPLLLIALLSALAGVLAGCDTAPRQPNIVVVVLDTVRRDATGLPESTTPAALRRPGLTPHLDRLASEGVTFTHAWSASPWTAPSHASMFTGLLPFQHNCLMNRPILDGDIPTAAEQLLQAGYHTAAIFSNPWLSDKSTRSLRGFESKFMSEVALGTMANRSGDQGGSGSLVNLRRWFDGRRDDRPFLLFVNFLEAHMSYDPPAAYREQHLADLPPQDLLHIMWGHEFNAGLHPAGDVDWDRVTRLYAGDVWFADQLLGALLAMLQEHGLDDETIVIVTSDHGENLGDHGLMEHQFSVHETLLSVPLVVRVPPGLAADRYAALTGRGVRRDTPVQTTDLYATLLDLAGLSDAVQAAPTASRSLLQPGDPERLVVADYGGPGPGLIRNLERMNPDRDLGHLKHALQTVRQRDLRLTVDEQGGLQLHDLAADPGQTTNLAAQRPADTDRLLAILQALPRGKEQGSQPVEEMDPETRRKLESLGYVR